MRVRARGIRSEAATAAAVTVRVGVTAEQIACALYTGYESQKGVALAVRPDSLADSETVPVTASEAAPVCQ